MKRGMKIATKGNVRTTIQSRRSLAAGFATAFESGAVMGFGLCGAPATYARIMNLVFRGLSWKTVLAFLDDIVVLVFSSKGR